jgi:hypothetical protein
MPLTAAAGEGGGEGGGAEVWDFDGGVVGPVLRGCPGVCGDEAEGAADVEGAGEDGCNECGGYHAVCSCYENYWWCRRHCLLGCGQSWWSRSSGGILCVSWINHRDLRSGFLIAHELNCHGES